MTGSLAQGRACLFMRTDTSLFPAMAVYLYKQQHILLPQKSLGSCGRSCIFSAILQNHCLFLFFPQQPSGSAWQVAEWEGEVANWGGPRHVCCSQVRQVSCGCWEWQSGGICICPSAFSPPASFIRQFNSCLLILLFFLSIQELSHE